VDFLAASGIVKFDANLILDNCAERELVTPPLNGLILPGITRDSILHLAREWQQFKVSERSFTMTEVQQLLYEGRVSLEI